jgi:hypothetical protein
VKRRFFAAAASTYRKSFQGVVSLLKRCNDCMEIVSQLKRFTVARFLPTFHWSFSSSGRENRITLPFSVFGFADIRCGIFSASSVPFFVST